MRGIKHNIIKYTFHFLKNTDKKRHEWINSCCIFKEDFHITMKKHQNLLKKFRGNKKEKKIFGGQTRIYLFIYLF